MFADVTFIGIRWFVFVETEFKISFKTEFNLSLSVIMYLRKIKFRLKRNLKFRLNEHKPSNSYKSDISKHLLENSSHLIDFNQHCDIFSPYSGRDTTNLFASFLCQDMP